MYLPEFILDWPLNERLKFADFFANDTVEERTIRLVRLGPQGVVQATPPRVEGGIETAWEPVGITTVKLEEAAHVRQNGCLVRESSVQERWPDVVPDQEVGEQLLRNLL